MKKRILIIFLVITLIFSVNMTVTVSAETYKKGSSGSAVASIHEKLITLGYMESHPEDIFDSATVSAVKKFQKKYGLSQTGKADSETLAKLKNAYNKKIKYSTPKKVIKIKASSANLRKGPGTRYSKLSTAKRNMVFAVTGIAKATNGSIWYRFKNEGKTMWVSCSKVTVTTEKSAILPNETVDEKVERIMSLMTTEEKVGQLLLIRGDNLTEEKFKSLISTCKVGGVVLFRKDFEGKSKKQVKSYIAGLQKAGDGKLLVCVDEEGGTVVRMSCFTALRSSRFMSPQELYENGGFENIKSDTADKCTFLKGFGVNVNLGPVADVVTNPDGVLYKRSFGKNATKTAKYVSTVVGVMNEKKVGSSLKHFPGYGNSTGDTHNGLDHNTKTLRALKKSDLVPFKSGIDAGADSIMVTHTIIDKVDSGAPASMSAECIALIRDYLGFDGVVITDGLDMGAIKEFCGKDDPCVRCILAGCDLLCTPSDAKKSYNNLLSAVKNGTIDTKRLDESVERIIRWKIELGLY